MAESRVSHLFIYLFYLIILEWMHKELDYLQSSLFINLYLYWSMSVASQSSIKIPRQQSGDMPTTYFELVERVGDSGKYQIVMSIVFSISFFVTGIILLSTGFLFRNRSFDCKHYGLLIPESACTDYVCQLPQNQWQNFISPDDKDFTSLATEDNYLCDRSSIIDFISSCTYFGAFVGYVVISFFSDNFGRKSSMVVSWVICTVGTIIVALSFNIYMVAVGLFLSGCGSDAAVNICFFFFGEVVGDKKRQKYSVFVQIFWTLGAMLLTLLFFLIDNWRLNWIIVVVIPALIKLFLLLFYIEETPQFLIKKGVEPTLKAMNRIGYINLGIREILDRQDIQNVMKFQGTQEFKDQYVTPIDLCRFPSLRRITISCSIISFMTYAMYYGPTLIIDDIGFDIYVSSWLINLSELLAYVPSYLWIQKIARKKVGIILFLVCFACALFLTFLVVPDQCEDPCIQSIIELIVVFIFRGCVSFFFCFFQVYFCELYPSRARGMGAGIVSAVGTLASTSSPIFLGYLRRNGINVMSLYILFAIIAIGNLMLLKQTKGLPLLQQIQQIEMQKQKRRSRIGSTIKASKIRDKSQLTGDSNA